MQTVELVRFSSSHSLEWGAGTAVPDMTVIFKLETPTSDAQATIKPMF